MAVVLLVVLAGCAGFGGGDGAEAAETGSSLQFQGGTGGGDDGVATVGGESGGSDGGGSATVAPGEPLQADRAIVRTGSLAVQVENFSAARTEIGSRAQPMGGYVSGSDATRHTRDGESWTTGHVVVRVPAERFQAMLAFARERGTVLQEETSTEDVTDRLVDLQARLNNSKERRDRLRTFYERAESTDGLLDVEERLSSVQAEIERLQAQLQSLRDRVAYSTLRVRLVEPGASGAAGVDTRDASLVSAFLTSAASAVDYLYGTLLFAVRLAPYLGLFGLPALVVGVLTRRRYGSWRASPVGAALGRSRSGESSPSAESGQSRSGSVESQREEQ